MLRSSALARLRLPGSPPPYLALSFAAVAKIKRYVNEKRDNTHVGSEVSPLPKPINIPFVALSHGSR